MKFTVRALFFAGWAVAAGPLAAQHEYVWMASQAPLSLELHTHDAANLEQGVDGGVPAVAASFSADRGFEIGLLVKHPFAVRALYRVHDNGVREALEYELVRRLGGDYLFARLPAAGRYQAHFQLLGCEPAAEIRLDHCSRPLLDVWLRRGRVIEVLRFLAASRGDIANELRAETVLRAAVRAAETEDFEMSARLYGELFFYFIPSDDREQDIPWRAEVSLHWAANLLYQARAIMTVREQNGGEAAVQHALALLRHAMEVLDREDDGAPVRDELRGQIRELSSLILRLRTQDQESGR